MPFLSYALGRLHGALVELIVEESATPLHLEPIYETDMAEGLKAMALEGHGLAFLPASSVKKELQHAPARPRGGRRRGYEVTMEVRIYRERPEVARHAKPGRSALWEFLRRERAYAAGLLRHARHA